MREARYRFPDDVRSTTRSIAAEMLREGSVAQTPEQFDAWISARSEVRESLAGGGYGTAFTSRDLFPLLQVFLGPAGRPAPVDPEPTVSPMGRWMVPALIAAFVLLLLILLFA